METSSRSVGGGLGPESCSPAAVTAPAAPETTSFTMPHVIVTAPTATPTTHVAVAATVATGNTVTADAILAQPRVADGREGSRLW